MDCSASVFGGVITVSQSPTAVYAVGFCFYFFIIIIMCRFTKERGYFDPSSTSVVNRYYYY